MHRVQKSSVAANWAPSASIPFLKKRAQILADVRAFLESRGMWEVETPILSWCTTTNPLLECIPVAIKHMHNRDCYLQTSPEFGMKRLLCAGSGSIFQITKSFRGGELGKNHNVEFTMLEWYQLGYSLFDMMEEVEALCRKILLCPPMKRMSYREWFLGIVEIDPDTATQDDLRAVCEQHGIDQSLLAEQNSSLWTDWLLTHVLEPALQTPTIIYHYPASQAALSQLTKTEPAYAERFEVYVRGVELANAYHELQDPVEQLNRAKADNEVRQASGLPLLPEPHHLVAALEVGLPDCSGVALGFDRLVMLALSAETLAEVVAFPFERA